VSTFFSYDDTTTRRWIFLVSHDDTTLDIFGFTRRHDDTTLVLSMIIRIVIAMSCRRVKKNIQRRVVVSSCETKNIHHYTKNPANELNRWPGHIVIIVIKRHSVIDRQPRTK